MKTTNKTKLMSAYNTGILSEVAFATAVHEVWNDELGDICAADLTCVILEPIFSGIRNGKLYLANNSSGVAWAMLASAFRDLAPMSEVRTGVRAAWKAAGHKSKLNSGFLADFTEEGKRKSKPSTVSNSTPDITVSGIEWEIKYLLKHGGKKSEIKKMLMGILANL